MLIYTILIVFSQLCKSNLSLLACPHLKTVTASLFANCQKNQAGMARNPTKTEVVQSALATEALSLDRYHFPILHTCKCVAAGKNGFILGLVHAKSRYNRREMCLQSDATNKGCWCAVQVFVG